MISKMWETSGRRLAAVCAILLLGSMVALDVAHFRHHMAEAATHADGEAGHHHDMRDCAIFHSVPPAESTFAVSIPEAPAAFLPLCGTQLRTDGPPLIDNGPRAPPASS